MIYSRPRPQATTSPATPAMVSRAEHDAAMQALSRIKDAEIARLTARIAELEGTSAGGDDHADAHPKRGKRGS